MANPSLDFSVASNFGYWGRFGGALVINTSVVALSGTATVTFTAGASLTVLTPTTFVPAPQRTKAVRRLARTGNVF